MAEIWTMGEMIVDLIRAEHRRFLLIQWRDSDIRAELSEE